MIIEKSTLLSIIKEKLISEKRDLPSDLSMVVLMFKRELKKRRLSCKINFLQPDPDEKYGDFGSLDISIDRTCGRSKGRTKYVIEKFVLSIASKIGLLKYFNYNGSGQNGNWLEMDFDLKGKYVDRYVNKPKQIEGMPEEKFGTKGKSELPKYVRLL